MKDVCAFISEWKIEELWASSNQISTTLQEISTIKFPKLKKLSFSFNKINSIEGINKIYMPVLEQIYLSTNLLKEDNNEITFVTDLKKENFPSLTALAISGQKIKDGSSLFRLQSSKLKNLFIEYEEVDQPSCFDIRWVMKLKTL